MLFLTTGGGCHFGTKLFGIDADVKFQAQECCGVWYEHNQATRSAAFATAPSHYAMTNVAGCQAAIAQIIRTGRGSVMCAWRELK